MSLQLHCLSFRDQTPPWTCYMAYIALGLDLSLVIYGFWMVLFHQAWMLLVNMGKSFGCGPDILSHRVSAEMLLGRHNWCRLPWMFQILLLFSTLPLFIPIWDEHLMSIRILCKMEGPATTEPALYKPFPQGDPKNRQLRLAVALHSQGHVLVGAWNTQNWSCQVQGPTCTACLSMRVSCKA